MADIIRSEPTVKRPTHHIKLTNPADGKSLGLVLCDSRGVPIANGQPWTLRGSSSPRTNLQINQGDSEYSKYKLPYTPITQKDWSGGRGLNDFEDDKTRYFDSYGLDMSAGYVTLAPRRIEGHIETGLRFSDEFLGPLFVCSANETYAGRFIPYVTITPDRALIWVRSITCSCLTIKFYSHNASTGRPGSELFSKIIPVPDEIKNKDIYFPLECLVSGVTFTQDVTYWVGITVSYDGTTILKSGNYLGLYRYDPDDSNKDGFTWDLANNDACIGLVLTSVPSHDGKFVQVGNKFYFVSIKSTGSNLYLYDNLNNTFSAISGASTNLTKAVTSICVYNEIIYFAQGSVSGSCDYIVRYNTSTNTFAKENTYADRLELIANTTGKNQIWRSLNSVAEVSYSDVKAWGSNLIWSSAIVCDNPGVPIVNIVAYDEPSIPWILKEDCIGSIGGNSTSGYVFAKVPINAMRAVRSSYNGLAFLHDDVYLYFSLLNGLERFYQNRLDDIGCDKDEGMPDFLYDVNGNDEPLVVNRNGHYTKLVPYPGRIYATYAAGYAGWSGVQVYNHYGWCELYRSTCVGSEIVDACIQVADEQMTETRLWICENGYPYYFVIKKTPNLVDARQLNVFGSFETGWIKTGYSEVEKYWSEIEIYGDFLATYPRELFIEYKTEDQSTWTKLSRRGPNDPNYGSTIYNLEPLRQVHGKQIKFRISIYRYDTGWMLF